MSSKVKTVQNVIDAVNTSALIDRDLTVWRPILAKECQVYVCGEQYIGKRFDAINYKFCEKMEAEEIVLDNLYALLRFKYFPKTSEEIDEKIKKIVNSFTANLKTTLRRISFDTNADCDIMHLLPDYCIAFRNGVYDFKNNNWFIKYDITEIEKISNKIYMYRNDYAILWYMDYNFDPWPINIAEISLSDFIAIMREVTIGASRNLCFELMYNISHTADDVFSPDMFLHLCEVLGYTVLQSFSQHFVMLIGSGQNGKNSLFDGCFTHRVVPIPAANDLDAIENDRFITGSLENKFHNIFLETSAKVYTESKMIKALTGSMYQTIESKGISKYSGVINCKYLFAGNDQDKIKFADNTLGFRRRINMFEIYYQWDAQKRFLKRGDYYDTSFSDDLQELKENLANTSAYIYFAMYGIMQATKQFTSNFAFTMNAWNYKYTDIDMDIKEKIESINAHKIVIYLRSLENNRCTEDIKNAFYSAEEERLYAAQEINALGYKTPESLIKFFEDEDDFTAFFAENDIYFSIRSIQTIINDITPPKTFTMLLKKIYMIPMFKTFGANKSYAKCRFVNQRLQIIK